MDIFRAKLPLFDSPQPYVIVKGKLIDAKTGQPISSRIIYERLSDGKEMGIAQSDPRTGEYEIRLPGGEQYGVRAEAEGHISENQNLDLTQFKADGVVSNKDMDLDPIAVARVEPKATITLNNIFFDFAKAELKSTSFPELNRIVDLMKQQATIDVEITGHADATGPAEYNMTLSKFRADKVAGYLINKGIAKERITVSYLGETKPAVSNDTPENRGKNRRVEFTILKM
jgi:OOP family OmpA-OmpF porin